MFRRIKLVFGIAAVVVGTAFEVDVREGKLLVNNVFRVGKLLVNAVFVMKRVDVVSNRGAVVVEESTIVLVTISLNVVVFRGI